MAKAFYRVEKFFKGGSNIFYIEISPDKLTEDVLEMIGEHTPGGHNLGYNIKTRKIKQLPKGAKLLNRSITHNLY